MYPPDHERAQPLSELRWLPEWTRFLWAAAWQQALHIRPKQRSVPIQRPTLCKTSLRSSMSLSFKAARPAMSAAVVSGEIILVRFDLDDDLYPRSGE